jgi:uracil-DNA glycosylase
MSMPKLKIVEKKINNDSSILELISGVHSSWKEVFESADDELKMIDEILIKHEATNGISFPFKTNIFKPFQLTPVSKVKAVFINVEPYAGINYDGSPLTDGLAFSVNEQCTIPKDLLALYNEVAKNVTTFKIPTHGNLTSWAVQGILLLNLSLTVTPNKPKSHGEIWHGFISKVIEHLAIHKPKVPFILFGDSVKNIASLISGQSLVVSTSNPSYTKKFLESNCIKVLLENWIKKEIEPINWEL